MPKKELAAIELAEKLERYSAGILSANTYNLLMSAATMIKRQALEIEHLKRKIEDDNK